MTDPRRPSARGMDEMPPGLTMAFAPLHKAAFGAGLGSALAVLVFVATLVSLVRDPDQRLPLWLLEQYFEGYSVTVPGAFIGAAWAWFCGFVFGWFAAFCRNLTMAAMLFVIRTRAELAQTRDFLDHV